VKDKGNGKNLNEQSVGVMEFELRNVRVRFNGKEGVGFSSKGGEETATTPNICTGDME